MANSIGKNVHSFKTFGAPIAEGALCIFGFFSSEFHAQSSCLIITMECRVWSVEVRRTISYGLSTQKVATKTMK